MIDALPVRARALLPQGAATLAALHDLGKITPGFQAKSSIWLAHAMTALPGCEPWQISASETDHALVSQVELTAVLKPSKSQLWAVAVGAHHGGVKPQSAQMRLEALGDWFAAHRRKLIGEMCDRFGPLPSSPPDPGLKPGRSDLWLLAGLISVADWIGSNEAWFPADRGLAPEEARGKARVALGQIGWPGGGLKATGFHEAFHDGTGSRYEPNPLQTAVRAAMETPGMVVVEGPMGCGKTEAALSAAQGLIAGGRQHGIYFALPTQVTSNRIHLRVAAFLRNTLAEGAPVRLAHGSAWMEDDFDLRLRPAHNQGSTGEVDGPEATPWEARSWFASAKQALLATYGVGTIDQALQGVVAVRHFFVRRFALAGKVVILDEVHSYDVYTGSLITSLIRELAHLQCSIIVLSATLTGARRRELLGAAGITEVDSPSSYPLVTVGAPGAECRHIPIPPGDLKRIQLTRSRADEMETIEGLVARAEQGQHVLWIRNTVAEAQAAFRLALGTMKEGAFEAGLLHSRFPFQRRLELEEEWLGRLGKHRAAGGPGSLLVATQVVEQSVDIDLDHIVSDLAPTDMLLQRMGRLWRHGRSGRRAGAPEFTLRLPATSTAATADELRRSLGASARVYAPYVLLRTMEVWRTKSEILLPSDIRALIENTYAEPAEPEPESWLELHRELREEKEALALNAAAATRVLGNPALGDEEEVLTRRKGAPTTPVLLLRSAQALGNGGVRLAAMDGSSIDVDRHEWRRAAAKFIHRWIVRAPSWMVPRGAPQPAWLGLHGPRKVRLAFVGEDGRCHFEDLDSPMAYHPRIGLFAEKSLSTTPKPWSDETDEFDY